MKKIFLIIFLSVIILSCSADEQEIEIISDYNNIYLTEESVDIKAEPLEDSEYFQLNEELKKIVNDLHKENSNKNKLYPIGYRIYINENGRIDKIMDLSEEVKNNIISKYISRNSEFTEKDIFLHSKSMTEKILSLFKKTKFNPAKLDGKSVPFRTDLKVIAVVNKQNEVNLELDWNLNMELNFSGKFLSNKEEYLLTVEEMPSPIGGVAAIQSKIEYPELAKRSGIQGRVYVKAFIDEKGNVVWAELIRGIGGGCELAAINAVEATKFNPGRKNGKPVKVQVSIPIMFKLN